MAEAMNGTEEALRRVLPGIVTSDAPAPLEHHWRTRDANQHAIPYEELTVRKGLRVYDAMLQDETIAYGFALKRMCRMATGWSLMPPTDREGDPVAGSEEVLDHVQGIVEQFDRFDAFLEQMLDATRQGFKLGEIVTRDGRVDGKPAWVIDDVLVRNSRWFAFDPDESGRLKRDGVLEFVGPNPDGSGIQSIWDPANTRRHPIEKFVHWAWQGLDCNAYSLYGRSDFYPIYRAFFLGDTLLKGWGETLDTYRHPIMVGIARAGLPEPQRTDFLNQLVGAIKRKALVVPAEYLPDAMDPEKAIRLHEVQGKADDFATAESHVDKLKMRGLMIGSLVSDVGSEGKGSYALGQQHVALFLKVLESIGKGLGNAVGIGLFRKLVRVNLGEDKVRLTPTLRFSSAGDTEAKERAEIIKLLIDAGIVDPTEPWVREYVGSFPDPEPEVLEVQEAERDARIRAAKEPPQPAGGGGTPKGKGATALDVESERPWDALEAKVDARAVQARMDVRSDRYVAQLRREWRRIFDGPGGIKAQARVGMSRPAADVGFRVDGTTLIDVMRRWSIEATVEGAVDALREVNRGRAAMGLSAVDVEHLREDDDPQGRASVPTLDLASFARAQGVVLDDAIEDFASRVKLRQGDLTEISELRMAQIREEVEAQIARLRVEARQSLLAARSKGKKASKAIQEEFRELEEKWAGVERDLGNQQSALSETIEASAYNEGRIRLYESTPKTVVAGYLYSAVLDSRTTPFCRAWDGYRAPRDHPVWKTILPPNHWRCRAIPVAVLAGEMSAGELARAGGVQPTEKPHAGFGGSRFIPPVSGLG